MRGNVPLVTEVNDTMPTAGDGSADPKHANRRVELISHSKLPPDGGRFPPQFNMGECGYAFNVCATKISPVSEKETGVRLIWSSAVREF
jgi:hypothetical protein